MQSIGDAPAHYKRAKRLHRAAYHRSTRLTPERKARFVAESITLKQAVERVSAIAHAKLPATLHGHLERGTALVLHRHVCLGEDGSAQVLSSDGTTWYRVNGNCTCLDAPKAPQGMCKHK